MTGPPAPPPAAPAPPTAHNRALTDRLAQRLRAARKARGLSLAQVGQLAGVSRSMVSQIERGESRPTVAVLWNLARAPGLDLARLLAPEGGAVAVTRAAAAPRLTAAPGVSIRILSPPEAVGRHEVCDLRLDRGAVLDSRAHGPGCREHLTVLDGALTESEGGAPERLGPGDTARYPADRPHRIAAEDGPARALLIVQGGG
jgi:transcriptional regulator with XRE-family HTH domain